MKKIHIGTSGWVYKHWKGIFYPEELPQTKWLQYYSENFDTVEVNSTFYHSANVETVKKWVSSVPGNFTFCFKASRYITHIKRLANLDDSIEFFYKTIYPAGKKQGPSLFQLPPMMKADTGKLEEFFRVLKMEGRKKVTFEFRDKSWFVPGVYKILEKNNAALVIADSGGRWPAEEVVTADFVYLRFHGNILYASNYPDRELKKWAEKIVKWRKKGLKVYAFFNNDYNAFAVKNARRLIDLVR